jgi:F0F1-type ATP synthase assembly protein I
MKSLNQENKNNWWQPALATFARLSSWIIAPVIIGLIIGRWLDQKYNTEPWLFLATTGFAFFVSMYGLIKETIKQYKKLESDSKNKKDKEEKQEQEIIKN